jgi:hypothetical protein
MKEILITSSVLIAVILLLRLILDLPLTRILFKGSKRRLKRQSSKTLIFPLRGILFGES